MTGSRTLKPWEYESHSAADTEALGQRVGHSLRGGEMMALYGDLGTGKTSLIRGIAIGLDIPSRAVSSPTFVLVHRYVGRLMLIHADLYRLDTIAEFHHLGIDDDFDGRVVFAIEWAEKAARELPSDRMDIHLTHVSRTRRHLRFRPTGPHSQALLNRIIAAETKPPRRVPRPLARRVEHP